jgi:Ion channel
MATKIGVTLKSSQRMRRLFFAALYQQVHLLWPIFSGILIVMVGCGLMIGWIEGWGIGESLYFTFVTGLTIGYGDLAPKNTVARMMIMPIGLCGIVLTGLVAAVSVQALDVTDRARRGQDDISADGS